MVEHPNVKRLRDVYAAFDKADLNGVLDEFADDAVVHFKGDGPNSGDHEGGHRGRAHRPLRADRRNP
jgi:ketosteroid isomerase-like protein